MNGNIERINELNNALSFPQATGMAALGVGSMAQEYSMECGTCLAWNLLYRPEVSCANWFMSSGCRFGEHEHEQVEIIIVYKGSLKITVGGVDTLVKAGESFTIKPRTRHHALALEDVWAISTTVPCSPNWPRPDTEEHSGER